MIIEKNEKIDQIYTLIDPPLGKGIKFPQKKTIQKEKKELMVKLEKQFINKQN